MSAALRDSLDASQPGKSPSTQMPRVPSGEPRTPRTGLALSIQQPWAWLIVTGHKAVENRDWPTKVRGWVGIHAGQKFDHEGYAWVRAEFPQIELPAPEAFARGGIVGRARLVECVEELDSPWFFGRFGFVFADAEPLPLTPCRGQLGFFRPSLSAPAQTEADR